MNERSIRNRKNLFAAEKHRDAINHKKISSTPTKKKNLPTPNIIKNAIKPPQ